MRSILIAAILLPSFAAAANISTIAGNGVAGYSETQVNNPYGLVTGPDGALYICETGNHVVRRLDMKSGRLSTVAGNGKAGYSGDGGPATEASLNEPYEVAFDRSGNMYFVERLNHVIRRVDRITRKISTVAGTGKAGFSGDKGPAVAAQMNEPHSIAFAADGRLLVCDIRNNRIRLIDLKNGSIETIFTGEKGKPTNGPRAIAVGAAGNLYIAFREGNSVYRLSSATGKLTHIAGTGAKGYSGDKGPATKAELSGPKGIALSRSGLYIADTESHTIRRISLRTGIIETVAGTGERGDGPEGDPLRCKMSRPHGVFVDKSGVIYVGDSEAHRVRVIR
jgi:DNA-binding beta-propeller fold protein YncE